MKKKWLKQFIRKRNLKPFSNRRKVGIILFSATIAIFSIFIARFSYIIVSGHVGNVSLDEKTQELYQGSSVVKAKRGSILDRNGDPIAEDATSYSLYAVIGTDFTTFNVKGEKVNLFLEKKNESRVASLLQEFIQLDAHEFESKVSQGRLEKRYQVEFGNAGKNITLEIKNKIEEAMKKEGLYGIYFTEHPDRIYPNGIFASHLIGYTDLIDQDNEEKGLQGVMGIEMAYNEILSGKDGKIRYQKDSKGNKIPTTIVEEKKAEDGENIYLTIDRNLQLQMENLMDQVVEKYEPENITAVLMEAKTGNVLAASQRPSFNPETKAGLDGENAFWRNLLIEDGFEPGSTMKVMTVAAAIESGNFNGNATFQTGTIDVADKKIKDWKPMGTLTYSQALPASSNVGMVHLEQAMGETWQNYLTKFGFGKSTGSNLPHESPGLINSTNEVDRAMSSFGQAISVTDFQMMQAFTAIGNKGTMLQPHYISKTENAQSKKTTKVQPKVVGQPISENTASQVLGMMRETITEDYGTGYGVYGIDGYDVAAKTGTAEIVGPNGYMTGEYDYIYSVVQMAPTDNTDYIMYVTLRRPQNTSTETYPSKMISSISNPLLKRALDLDAAAGAEPKSTSESGETKFILPDFTSQEVSTAKQTAENAGLEVVVLGEGNTVENQSAKKGETLLAKQKLFLLTEGQKYIPDLTRWSKSDVLKLGELLDIEIETEGQGFVTKQSIENGTPVSGKEKLKVTLQN